MRLNACIWALSVGAAIVLSQSAKADFNGQTILGPLTAGSMVSGNTLGHSDDNDGFDSGGHFFDIWDGGDDVWLLNWAGGTLTVTLDSLGGSDNDLFLYSPGAYDSTGDYSIVGAHDSVTILDAAAGTYYINVDSTMFSEGGYELSVSNIPAPGSLALLGIGGLYAGRRRR